MSAETATAKRVSRTLRASPVKEGAISRTPIPREDIENLSAVTLAALGLPTAATTTPQASDRVHKRMSKTSSEMYATPPSTVMPASKSRTVSSSSHVSTNNNSSIQSSNSGSSSRARDRTATSSSLASSDVSSPHARAPQAPLTAIRRPAPQSHHQNTTPATGSRTASASRTASGSMKASPSSLKLSTNGSCSAVRSRKASGNSSHIAVSSSHNNRDTPSSARSRAPSSDASKQLQRDAEQPISKEKGVFVTQEEYSSLVALLSAKDEQIGALKEQVDEARKELSGLKDRNNKLQKERDTLLAEKKEILKSRTPGSGAAGKEGNNSPQGEEAGISKKEYESFKKQYEMQENLLEGFQRENEKATTELEALKKREKHLTEQLKKIYGPTFSVESDINPLTPEHGGISRRFPTSLISNGHGPGSPLNSGMFIGEQHRRRSGLGLAQISSKVSPSAAGEQQSESSVNHSEDRENAGRASAQERNDMNVEPARLMEQLVSVQALLERFEKRLLVRESELIKKEREAAEQMEKLQSIVVG